jgi:hypothetical protein
LRGFPSLRSATAAMESELEPQKDPPRSSDDDDASDPMQQTIDQVPLDVLAWAVLIWAVLVHILIRSYGNPIAW